MSTVEIRSAIDAATVHAGTAMTGRATVAGIGVAVEAQAELRYYDDQQSLVEIHTEDEWVAQIPFDTEPTPTHEALELRYSTSADMSNPLPLDGATVTGIIYVVLYGAESGIALDAGWSVQWELNAVAGTLDTTSPYQMFGGSSGSAVGWDTTTVADDEPTAHTVEAAITRADATATSLLATVTVESLVEQPEPDPDEPDPEPEPEPEPAAALIGHVSTDEVTEWRARVVAGTPYVSATTVDGSTRPGDWNVIVSNKTWTSNNLADVRWNGPTGNNPGGHVLHNTSTALTNSPPFDEPSNFRDACFYVMVQYDAESVATLATSLAGELVAQSNVKGVDFTNRDRFCLDGNHINSQNSPMWRIGTWITKEAFSYTYLRNYELLTGTTLFTAAQRTGLMDWFEGAMEWLWAGYAARLDGISSNWRTAPENGPWTLNNDEAVTEVPYDDGPAMRRTQLRLANRDVRSLRGAAICAEITSNATYRSLIRRGAKAVIMYGYSGDGWIGDFERGSASQPWKGLKYSQELYGGLAIIADLQARAGDTGLVDFTTTVDNSAAIEGNHLPQSTSAARSLWTMARDLAAYDTGDYNRTIGGQRIRTDASRADDANLLVLNHYAKVHGKYAADYVEAVFKRTAEGTRDRPSNPTTGQDIPPDNGVLPGWGHFMFVDLPIDIDPWS